MKTVVSVLRQYIESHPEYDGLAHPSAYCACENSDLMPCDDNTGSCEVGHKVPCDDSCEFGGGCDWHIKPGPRDEAGE